MIAMENLVFYAGVVYLFKILFNVIWDIKDGFNAYVLPKIFSIDYKQKYGEWAIVTGCTQGIGKCYAEELAQRGLNVVLISRTQSKLDTLANELKTKYGVATKIIVADFTDPKVLQRIVQEIERFDIDIGILVNNVGMLGPHQMPFLELDQQTVIDMINVNILSATVLCHSLLPKMKEKGKGAIINISSLAAYIFAPYLAEYAATKHYMSAFTMAIAEEYANCGVEIQCVEPGAVDTAMTQYFDENVKATGFPTPEKYAKSAFRTLGFSRRTNGYLAHSLMNWVLHALFSPTTNTFLLSNGAKQGKVSYENALSKQKTN